MATSRKPAFDGQSLEEFFASFAYKGGGGGHGDGIRKRNSSSGVGGSVDKRIEQRRALLSPNHNKNTPPPPPPPPPPSSSLQSTTNRKKTTMTKPPSFLNGLSPAEFIASFAYKGRRVDNRIGKKEDLLNPGTPPPPPPVQSRKRRKTATTTTTTVRRVTRFFPPPAGRFVVVDLKKDITGKGNTRSGGGTTRKRPRTTGNTGSTDANRQPQKRSKGRKKRRSIQLSAEEKFSDAYRRVSDHDIWDAPRSSHNLLQERHCFDPWRVLVICILLNVTNGNQLSSSISHTMSFHYVTHSTHAYITSPIQKYLNIDGI
ncbi:hypothetical protein COCNU_08G000440 [Cocos nucifera]|uniref:Uncharacterized protein n=1 Tax=Cocos nucifera TaxID=13894 RepID=A0A8K0IGL0_COCNU|nr:hypothetical protein COCNU_08G000440 [Cocos nucifera]